MGFEKHRVLIVLVSSLLSLLLISGCVQPSVGLQSVPVENAVNKGRLSLFLNLQDIDGPDLFMQISAIQLKSEKGTLITHSLESVVIESGKVKGGQKFIARVAVEPDKYTQVRLLIEEAGHVEEQGIRLVPLKLSEAVMEMRSPLDIAVGDSKSLFFTWDTKKSLQDNQFYPEIQLAPSLKKLVADVAYVSCPEIDTVFMVSTEQNRVIDSLGIPGHPSYLFQNGDSRSDEVFVIAEEDLRLYAFSPTTNRLTQKYNLTMLNKPIHAAFNPNGRWSYIIDRQLGTLFRMDLSSGTIDKQVWLNYDPVYIIYLPKYNLLAISLSISQTVVLVNAETMEQTGTISTGNAPDGLRFVNDRLLYIAESGANSVQIYDLDTHSMLKRVTVGFQPRRIIHTNNYVYVANYGDRSIWTLRYGLMASSRAISFPGNPLEMAYDDKTNRIYIGDQQTMSLGILNSLTNSFVGNVELGAVPQGILILQENNIF